MASGVQPIIDVDRNTGELIQGWPRCKQSIITILTTRLRTRLMRLWWGSEFVDAMDKPNNSQTFNLSINAALRAIDEYEPEFQIDRVLLSGVSAAGELICEVEGIYTPEKTSRKFTVEIERMQ